MPKNELYHHGIRGQRWGKRNGPPYPLNAQTHGAVVRSADREVSTGSKSTKKGKIGGVKDHLLANSVFDKSDTGRESYKEYIKAAGKSAAGMAIGGAAGAGIGAGIAALRKGSTAQGMALGGVVGSSLGSLAGTRSYVKSLKLGAKRHKEIREADRAKKGRIGGLPNENTKDNNTRSEAERKAKLKRRILIGAGVAAGVAGGALLGRKLYRAKAAQGAAGVESAASNLRTAFKRNKAAQPEAKKIAADLTNQRNKLTIDRFNAQTARNEAATKKGLSGFLKRRKIKKNIANLDSKLAENAAAKSRNAFAAGKTEMKYKYAQRTLKDSLATNEGLKKLGRRQAIASTLGLGVAGGATGYGISKIANRRKQKARIQNRRRRR